MGYLSAHHIYSMPCLRRGVTHMEKKARCWRIAGCVGQGFEQAEAAWDGVLRKHLLL